MVKGIVFFCFFIGGGWGWNRFAWGVKLKYQHNMRQIIKKKQKKSLKSTVLACNKMNFVREGTNSHRILDTTLALDKQTAKEKEKTPQTSAFSPFV